MARPCDTIERVSVPFLASILATMSLERDRLPLQNTGRHPLEFLDCLGKRRPTRAETSKDFGLQISKEVREPMGSTPP